MIPSYNDIELQFNIKIISAEIKGNRWSCLVKPTQDLPLSQPVRIRISEKDGFIIYPFSPVSDKQISHIKALLLERM